MTPGLDIVDFERMDIAHSYTDKEIGPNGCGGIQKGDDMFVNSGNADPNAVDVIYAFDNAKLPGKPAVYAVPQAGTTAMPWCWSGTISGAPTGRATPSTCTMSRGARSPCNADPSWPTYFA